MGISFKKRNYKKKRLQILLKKGFFQVFDHTFEEFKFAAMPQIFKYSVTFSFRMTCTVPLQLRH